MTETLLPFENYRIRAGSRFKEQSVPISATGTLPILRDSICVTASGETMSLYKALSIVENVVESFPDHAISPRDYALLGIARNLCSEMQSGSMVLRSNCA